MKWDLWPCWHRSKDVRARLETMTVRSQATWKSRDKARALEFVFRTSTTLVIKRHQQMPCPLLTSLCSWALKDLRTPIVELHRRNGVSQRPQNVSRSFRRSESNVPFLSAIAHILSYLIYSVTLIQRSKFLQWWFLLAIRLRRLSTFCFINNRYSSVFF